MHLTPCVCASGGVSSRFTSEAAHGVSLRKARTPSFVGVARSPPTRGQARPPTAKFKDGHVARETPQLPYTTSAHTGMALGLQTQEGGSRSKETNGTTGLMVNKAFDLPGGSPEVSHQDPPAFQPHDLPSNHIIHMQLIRKTFSAQSELYHIC